MGKALFIFFSSWTCVAKNLKNPEILAILNNTEFECFFSSILPVCGVFFSSSDFSSVASCLEILGKGVFLLYLL